MAIVAGTSIHSVEPGPSSPEDGSNFRRSLQIDMKGLVGDAIGNMSISPGSRDVVLATRNGLFIIDLEAPLNVPRFLPQGGTWDVADVQWNPHVVRGEYIVSTSSEKLLIWNLFLTGKTSIEHVLRSHYRAITDINWHTTDPDIVVSTGIDSWLWAWDLRATQKPIMGLCAFGSGGTQVKWNRRDGNLLASSHQNEVLLWDRRKGSLPISRIQAHTAKIYGIDWAHERTNEIVTCSLDKTIKIWDTQNLMPSEPKITIQTEYPVWRARDLPFGQGLLSLPQRGQTALEMYSHDNPLIPVEIFEGHADVVKEFVWRRGGSEFQLITWSKDKTLRFWPVDPDVMQKAGNQPCVPPGFAMPQHTEPKVTFSNPPVGTDLPPALSAPVGNRAILAEVRAPFHNRHVKVNQTRFTSEWDVPRPEPEIIRKDSSVTQSKPIPIAHEKGGTMTRGHIGGKSQISALDWLSSVKVGAKRDGSSGPGSGADSGNVSRFNSKSRPPSLLDRSASRAMSMIVSDTGERSNDGYHEGDSIQSLQDEITSVVSRLSTSKVKLEKAELTKKRTCTFGLHGPWGDSTSVFIRVSFTFPRDYPQASHPQGTPSVDLERNPLISMKSRAFMLRRLRAIREKNRPCLEKCLRFLLMGDEDDTAGRHPGMDSESSSDEDAPKPPRTRRGASFSLLRSDKNLAEPRTSQGVFSVNGALVCFFRAPPRIVRNPMREISVSPSLPSHSMDTAPRLFRSPVFLSDAVRLLSHAAQDRDEVVDLRPADDANNILRIMTNLFTFPQYKSRRVSEPSKSYEDMPSAYSLLPTRRSTVFIKDASVLAGIDIAAAQDYIFDISDPPDTCKKNAEIARIRGRVDHERVFKVLGAVLVGFSKSYYSTPPDSMANAANDLMIMHVVKKLYDDLSRNKDIQMLAMLSLFLLRISSMPTNSSQTPDVNTPASEFRRPLNHKNLSLSPIWSPGSPSSSFQHIAPALDSPSSSRGSWSSLFNANTMRHFVGGPRTRTAIPVPENPRMQRGYSSPLQGHRRDPQPPTPTTKSWSEATVLPPIASTVTFSSAGHVRHPTFSQVLSTRPMTVDKKRILVNVWPRVWQQELTLDMRGQLLCHVMFYAEVLLAWQLPAKRSELLKSVERELRSTPVDPVIIERSIGSDGLGYTYSSPLLSLSSASERAIIQLHDAVDAPVHKPPARGKDVPNCELLDSTVLARMETGLCYYTVILTS
ncbi:uncharacterized protein FIBRA_05520 [Fibroporia radiculosa]|uniref:Uncharacterized protein n=1 Tax=Fibroporia radiculosa TaxID=599839 RepID=J4GR69_9APHY|nr:uncharacterized protein FIBRA_05520 [Fibroporia radiculosa]CCM03390.1 predicted protein [Fibroporia radiculosa]